MYFIFHAYTVLYIAIRMHFSCPMPIKYDCQVKFSTFVFYNFCWTRSTESKFAA